MYYLLAGLAIPVTIAAMLLTRNPASDTAIDAVSGQPGQTTQEAAAQSDSGQMIKTLDHDATYQNIENTPNREVTKTTPVKTKKSEFLKNPDNSS